MRARDRLLGREALERSPLRVLVLGDTHGDHSHLRFALGICATGGISTIVQVGDNGYTWPGSGGLKHAIQLLEHAGVTMYWLEGNHDNYTELIELGFWGATTPQVYGSHNFVYLPRGCVFDLDGVRCGAFGGAVSVDKDYRILVGRGWWPEEYISDEQVDAFTEQVSVLFTHDAPYRESGPLEDYLTAEWRMPVPYEVQSEQSRRRIARLMANAKPRLLVHGHYHHLYGDMHRCGTKVIGLGHNGGRPEESYVIIDLDHYA